MTSRTQLLSAALALNSHSSVLSIIQWRPCGVCAVNEDDDCSTKGAVATVRVHTHTYPRHARALQGAVLLRCVIYRVGSTSGLVVSRSSMYEDRVMWLDRYLLFAQRRRCQSKRCWFVLTLTFLHLLTNTAVAAVSSGSRGGGGDDGAVGNARNQIA